MKVAPNELHDDDGLVRYVRVDRTTRGQAKAIFASELDLPFTEVAVHRVALRLDTEYAAEQEADGIAEPYDGWPYVECSHSASGAVAYWRGSLVGDWRATAEVA